MEKSMEIQQRTTEKNKKAIRTLFEECINQKDFERITAFVSDDFTGPQGKKGAEAFKAPILALATAFPDIHYHLRTMVAEGNKVAVSWTWEGTHTSAYQNIPPSEKKISNSANVVFEMKEGKILKSDLQTDRLGFLQAFELLPADPLLLFPNEGQLTLIDRFFVPDESFAVFKEKMEQNRKFLSTLPGLVKQEIYTQKDSLGNHTLFTLATWKNSEAVEAAKKAMKDEFSRSGFQPEEFYSKLKIKMDRDFYKPYLH